jgi:hypothetical protein
MRLKQSIADHVGMPRSQQYDGTVSAEPMCTLSKVFFKTRQKGHIWKKPLIMVVSKY